MFREDSVPKIVPYRIIASFQLATGASILPAKSAKNSTGMVRIIAGQWRGRRFPVADLPGLRPTTDRIRETLFNWLAPELAGRRCLDLFAGTGVLGLESLSRGAASCVFVEQQTPAVQLLRDTLTTLQAQAQAQVIQSDALAYLNTLVTAEPAQQIEQMPFDLVFLDPPFDGDLLQQTLTRLADSALLSSKAIVYLEFAPGTQLQLPSDWTAWRSKRSGEVMYALYLSK